MRHPASRAGRTTVFQHSNCLRSIGQFKKCRFDKRRQSHTEIKEKKPEVPKEPSKEIEGNKENIKQESKKDVQQRISDKIKDVIKPIVKQKTKVKNNM